MYTLAREEYRTDKVKSRNDSETVYIAVDMQKITSLPMSKSLKEFFFAKGLTVYNETFAELNGKNDICVLWHEGVQKRCGDDVASSYIRVIKSMNAKNFVFWADNCVGQNKNWYLFSALMTFIHEQGRIQGGARGHVPPPRNS